MKIWNKQILTLGSFLSSPSPSPKPQSLPQPSFNNFENPIRPRGLKLTLNLRVTIDTGSHTIDKGSKGKSLLIFRFYYERPLSCFKARGGVVARIRFFIQPKVKIPLSLFYLTFGLDLGLGLNWTWLLNRKDMG